MEEDKKNITPIQPNSLSAFEQRTTNPTTKPIAKTTWINAATELEKAMKLWESPSAEAIAPNKATVSTRSSRVHPPSAEHQELLKEVQRKLRDLSG